MKISVIIPCHNAELYLAQTIGSVLDQSRVPQEIIVIDDGSTDGSLDVARKFANACGADLIQVFSECSGSAAKTRNLGAALASGDALMFLDADDVLAPDALESLAKALADQPVGIAACPWRRLAPVNGQWLSQPPSCALRRSDQDALSAWLTGWYYPPCAVLWSKEAFLQTGGWDEEAALNDDGDLMMRALVSGIPLIETVSGTSYYRRLPEGQISLSGKRFTYGGIAGRIAVIEKVVRMLEEQGRIDPYRAPLGKAFSLIADDAAWHYAGLCEQARANMRQYGPSLWSRAIALARRRRSGIGGTMPAAAPPRDRVEEIRFGLDRAESVLASAPANPDPDHAIVHPLPDRPTVSVIIPVYNRAHLLSRTIDGVVKQTFTDFEILIIDDCSKDDPASVIADFKDSRLRYLRQSENGGVAAARNRGLREARAPFVAFLDDDDEWFPEKLAMQVDLFRRSPPAVALIYTGVQTVLSDGRRTLQEPSARGDLYRELLVRNILHGGGSNVMIRRHVVSQVGFFDESLQAIEDYEYWLRICRHYQVDCISAPLVRYHDNRDLSRSRGNEVRRSLNVKANLAARDQFYQKHGAQMRRAGVAHLFLIDSVRRHLKPEWNDVHAARRLALQAFVLAPASREAHHVLRKVFIPDKVRNVKKKMDTFKGQFSTRSRMHNLSRSGSTNPRVLQVHRFRYGTVEGGVDRVVTELFAGLGGSDAVLFEVGKWEDRGLTRRVEGDLTIYRRRMRLLGEPLSLLRRAWAYFEVLLIFLQLAWLIKRENIDLVHLHTLQYSHWYFLWLSRLGLCSYIITLHGTETVEYHTRAHIRWKYVLQNAQKVVAVSSELARIATVNLPIRTSPEVVYNGIDDPINSTTRNNELLGMEAKPYAICVGALRYCKGHDIAIKAWSELVEKGVAPELYIAGEGKERHKLESLCHELGCSEYVHFLGAVPHEQVFNFIKCSDYYLMPSRHEGLPIALLEAAALERPIIASNIPVFCEIVDDGISAELFAPEDHQALAEKIILLSNDLNRRMALGSAARKKFLNKFTKETMICNYRDLYKSSIQGHHIVNSTGQWFSWNRGNRFEKTLK